MCGIVGIVTRSATRADFDKLSKVFTQSLFCDTLRGKHGTGVLGVATNGQVSSYKRSLAAPDFLELDKAKSIINNFQNDILIGHNRFATQGGHTCENAHPFNHGHIHLFHNGTLDSHRTLSSKSFTVDSEAIAHLLSESEDVVSSLEKIEGAYSLVWYDEINMTLNFARNKERPMCFAHLEGNKGFIFASEAGMIKWLADRNGVDIKGVYSTKEGSWISIPLDPSKESITTKFTPKEATTYSYGQAYGYRNYYKKEAAVVTGFDYLKDLDSIVVTATGWEPYSANSSGGNRYGKITVANSPYPNLTIIITSIEEQDIGDYLGKKVRVKVNSISSNTAYCTILEVVKANTVITLPSPKKKLKGPNGIEVTPKAYMELTKNGCSMCSCTILEDDSDTIHWTANNDLLCEDCNTDFTYSIVNGF